MAEREAEISEEPAVITLARQFKAMCDTRRIADIAAEYHMTEPALRGYLQLLKLHPDAAALMRDSLPREERLCKSDAVDIARHPRESHLRRAQNLISARKKGHSKARLKEERRRGKRS